MPVASIESGVSSDDFLPWWFFDEIRFLIYFFLNKLDFYVFQNISLHRGTEEEISFMVGHAALQEIHVLNIHQTHFWYTIRKHSFKDPWTEEENVKKNWGNNRNTLKICKM